MVPPTRTMFMPPSTASRSQRAQVSRPAPRPSRSALVQHGAATEHADAVDLDREAVTVGAAQDAQVAEAGASEKQLRVRAAQEHVVERRRTVGVRPPGLHVRQQQLGDEVAVPVMAEGGGVSADPDRQAGRGSRVVGEADADAHDAVAARAWCSTTGRTGSRPCRRSARSGGTDRRHGTAGTSPACGRAGFAGAGEGRLR